MSWLQAIIFAIVEGLTEFLPVSSTAQILLVEKFLPVLNKELFSSFLIFIQLGAMLAVLMILWKKIWQNKNIWGKLIVAFIPTGILGAIAYPLVKNYLQNTSALTGWVLIVGGIIFTALDYYWTRKKMVQPAIEQQNDYVKEVQKAPWWKMMVIGVCQAGAMIPGVSRSAATIFGARGLGFSKMTATELSFIIALPTIAGATGLDLIKEWLNKDVKIVCDCISTSCVCPEVYSVFNNNQDLLLMIAGFIAAFIVALLTAKFFIKVLGKKPFLWWGIFRVITGIVWLLM